MLNSNNQNANQAGSTGIKPETEKNKENEI
jgi:hypothetical protein